MNYHIISWRKSEWSVCRQGASRAWRVFSTRHEAMAEGRKRAKRSGGNLYVHGKDGMVERRIKHEDLT